MTHAAELARRWQGIHADLQIAADEAELGRLIASWSEDGRHYHGVEHLVGGLRRLDEVGEGAGLARLAWVFHDAIYAVGAADNEWASAEWFEAYAHRQGLAAEFVRRGRELILFTRDHQAAVTDDPLWPLLNDVDLAVFAAPADAYDRYAADVWREYQAVATRRQFVLGRVAFMSAFDKGRIFRTEAMVGLEPVAHRNITAEVDRLLEEARREGWA